MHSFRGREKLSGLHRLEVIVSCPNGEEVVEQLSLGQPALFVGRVGHSTRRFGGVVTRVDALGARDNGRVHEFRMRLEPRMALLKMRKGSRIFQQLRVDQIVDAVCRSVGVVGAWRLMNPLPAREYCTQYEETDFQFVTRLCAEAGLYFHFVAAPAEDMDLSALWDGTGALAAPDAWFGPEAVVFSNDAFFYPAIADSASDASRVTADSAAAAVSPALRYVARQGTAAASEDIVSQFAAHASLRPNSAEFRDYDPARPQAPLVARAAHVESDEPGVASAIAELAKATLADRPLESHALEIYEHHGAFLFPHWDGLSDEPALMLRQHRRRARVAKGESGCSRLAPGHRFSLEDHAQAELNREWVVTAVAHEGHATPPEGALAWHVYKNRFECVPADVTYCPPRPARKNVAAHTTATVVGPAGNEIHTDADGRIQARFQWDRRGKSDDTTCWIRTMQPWAGEGYGVQFIPRVGMEVVVAFEGGDPDKPLVLGCVHNGTHPPGFPLPSDQTRSGFRTKSSPTGAGYNELSFDDASGNEQIYLHAQRDLDEEVGGNHTLTVEGATVATLGGSRAENVAGDSSDIISGNHTLHIGGDESKRVDGNRINVVRGTEDARVTGDFTLRLERRDTRDVRSQAEHRYGDDFTTRIAGNHTVIVGRHGAHRSLTMHTEGTTTLSATREIVLEANGGLTLRCGNTAIRIGADGIELTGPMIRAAGESGGLEAGKEGLKLHSAGVYAQLAEKLFVKTESTTLAMGKEVKLDGPKILFNSPEQATEAPPPEPPPPTEIELLSHDGKPLANQRFVVELEDGSQRCGVTDKDGKAALDLTSSGKIRFPELTDVQPLCANVG